MTTNTRGGPLLFPLNRISAVDVAALQFKLRAKPLVQPAFMRQRYRAYGAGLAPELPVNRPWNAVSSRFGIIDVQTSFPTVVHALLPTPPTFFQIAGQTKDSTGAALGNCVVDLFRTADDVRIETLTSNADGYFYFKSPVQAATHYVVAYKVGAPDVAGTTLNTLVGT